MDVISIKDDIIPGLAIGDLALAPHLMHEQEDMVVEEPISTTQDTQVPPDSKSETQLIIVNESTNPVLIAPLVPLLNKVPLTIWRDEIIAKSFGDTKDHIHRHCLVNLVRVCKFMFQASAPVLYKSVPIQGLKYLPTKKIFTESILKSVQEKRILANRVYGLYVHDLDWTNACKPFIDKHATDTNIHRVVSACTRIKRLAIPSMSGTKITDRTLRSVARVCKGSAELNVLRIENVNCFTADGLDQFFNVAVGQVHTLECYSRYTNLVSGSQIMAMLAKNRVHLRNLVLVECPLDNLEPVQEFARECCKSMRLLELNGVPIHINLVKMLANPHVLVNLHHLTLHTDEVIGDASEVKDVLIQSIFSHISNLSTLYLHGFPITDTCLKSITNNKLKLKSLTLSNAELSDPRVLCTSVIAKSPKLVWVDVSGNTMFRQNSDWADCFPTNSGGEEEEDAWWNEDNEEITFGTSKVNLIRTHFQKLAA